MVHNISNEKYEEIKTLILFCFSKYFKKFAYLKDDLIQEGLISVFKHLEDFDESKSNYSTFVIRYAYYGMIVFIDNIYKKASNRKYNKFDYDLLSLDTNLNTSSENYTLSDILVDNTSDKIYNSLIDKDCLQKCIKSALIKCCSFKGMSIKTLYWVSRHKCDKKRSDIKYKKYKVLCDYLKTLSVSITAENLGVTRQYVSLCKKDFEKYLKHELIENGFYN